MEDLSYQKKAKPFEAVTTAISLVAVGAAIASMAARKKSTAIPEPGTIVASGSPAKEALYVVKGVLLAEGQQTDIREFELRIRQ